MKASRRDVLCALVASPIATMFYAPCRAHGTNASATVTAIRYNHTGGNGADFHTQDVRFNSDVDTWDSIVNKGRKILTADAPYMESATFSIVRARGDDGYVLGFSDYGLARPVKMGVVTGARVLEKTYGGLT